MRQPRAGRDAPCQAGARLRGLCEHAARDPSLGRATREGVTTAAINLIIDEVTEDDRLVEATTLVAERIELAGEGVGPALDFFIPVGGETVLDEQGIHLRLVGLDRQLRLGRTFPLKLRFEKGGLVHTTLNVDQLPLPAAPPATSR